MRFILAFCMLLAAAGAQAYTWPCPIPTLNWDVEDDPEPSGLPAVWEGESILPYVTGDCVFDFDEFESASGIPMEYDYGNCVVTHTSCKTVTYSDHVYQKCSAFNDQNQLCYSSTTNTYELSASVFCTDMWMGSWYVGTICQRAYKPGQLPALWGDVKQLYR